MITRNCRGCGIQITGCPRKKNELLYCSRKCYGQHKARRQLASRALSDGLLAWAKSWGTCQRCHCAFLKGRSTECFCSDECRRIPKSVRVPVEKACHKCKAVFSTEHKGRLHCDRCRLEAIRDDRRFFKTLKRVSAGAEVDRSVRHSKVYERDDYICYLCGCKTNPEAHELSDRYPTIDHVIPLAAGGSHTWDNVRCACRSCNSNKGEFITLEQMLTSHSHGPITHAGG